MKRLFTNGVGLLALLALSGLILLPVYLLNGWPLNHESEIFFQRTVIYSQHLSQGDWFPIWSTADNYGFGSPFPALYHKLFYISSGIVLSWTGMMKESVLFSLWIWFSIGGLGMYMLCRQLKCPKFISWLGGMIFLLSNYTVSDWLIRGAMAELSAMMLVPWMLRLYLKWLSPEGRNLKNYTLIGFLLGLIFLSHSVIAYYLVLLLGFSTLLLAVSGRLCLSKLKLHFGLVALLIFGCAVGPSFLAIYALRGVSDAHRMIIPPLLPQYHVYSFPAYFWDSNWSWGADWDFLSPQLDIPILILFFSGILYLLGRQIYLRKTAPSNTPLLTLGDGFFAFIACTAMIFVLQTPIAIYFYRFFPGAEYLQFPWRLLGILMPLIIALSLKLWCAIPELKKFSRIGVGACFLGVLYLCGAWSIRHEIIPGKDVNLVNLILGWNGAYMPPIVRSNDPAPPENLLEVFTLLGKNDHDVMVSLHSQLVKTLKEKGCTIEKTQIDRNETLSQEFILACRVAGEVPLPIFGTPFHRLSAIDIETKQIDYSRCAKTDTFPGLCVLQLKNPGTYRVNITTPTFRSLIEGITN